ncbi:MAG: hypothetical protein HY963_00875 [Ignavibacteriales bacterium]|nr:hypothetical protein [Ignavibacteriales bacterium]
MSAMIYKTFYNSPIGLIEICGTENSITSLCFIDEEFNRKNSSKLASRYNFITMVED